MSYYESLTGIPSYRPDQINYSKFTFISSNALHSYRCCVYPRHPTPTWPIQQTLRISANKVARRKKE